MKEINVVNDVENFKKSTFGRKNRCNREQKNWGSG